MQVGQLSLWSICNEGIKFYPCLCLRQTVCHTFSLPTIKGMPGSILDCTTFFFILKLCPLIGKKCLFTLDGSRGIHALWTHSTILFRTNLIFIVIKVTCIVKLTVSTFYFVFQITQSKINSTGEITSVPTRSQRSGWR